MHNISFLFSSILFSFFAHAQVPGNMNEIVGEHQPAISKCYTSEFGSQLREEATQFIKNGETITQFDLSYNNSLKYPVLSKVVSEAGEYLANSFVLQRDGKISSATYQTYLVKCTKSVGAEAVTGISVLVMY